MPYPLGFHDNLSATLVTRYTSQDVATIWYALHLEQQPIYADISHTANLGKTIVTILSAQLAVVL